MIIGLKPKARKYVAVQVPSSSFLRKKIYVARQVLSSSFLREKTYVTGQVPSSVHTNENLIAKEEAIKRAEEGADESASKCTQKEYCCAVASIVNPI